MADELSAAKIAEDAQAIYQHAARMAMIDNLKAQPGISAETSKDLDAMRAAEAEQAKQLIAADPTARRIASFEMGKRDSSLVRQEDIDGMAAILGDKAKAEQDPTKKADFGKLAQLVTTLTPTDSNPDFKADAQVVTDARSIERHALKATEYMDVVANLAKAGQNDLAAKVREEALKEATAAMQEAGKDPTAAKIAIDDIKNRSGNKDFNPDNYLQALTSLAKGESTDLPSFAGHSPQSVKDEIGKTLTALAKTEKDAGHEDKAAAYSKEAARYAEGAVETPNQPGKTHDPARANASQGAPQIVDAGTAEALQVELRKEGLYDKGKHFLGKDGHEDRIAGKQTTQAADDFLKKVHDEKHVDGKEATIAAIDDMAKKGEISKEFAAAIKKISMDGELEALNKKYGMQDVTHVSDGTLPSSKGQGGVKPSLGGQTYLV